MNICVLSKDFSNLKCFSDLIFPTMGPPSPFSRDQEVWIVEQYAKLGRFCDVRRSYRLEYKLDPKTVPKDYAFLRVIQRFKDTGSLVPNRPTGRSSVVLSDENCDRVLALIQQDSTLSIRKLSSELNLSYTTIWRILRKELHMHPYKPKAVVPLTGEHKLARVEFCQ